MSGWWRWLSSPCSGMSPSGWQLTQRWTGFDSYNVGLPRSGTWYLRFNSDWRSYCADFGNTGYDTTAGGGPNQGMPFSGDVGLGAYSAMILSQ